MRQLITPFIWLFVGLMASVDATRAKPEVLACPDGSVHYDLQACDPAKPSECAQGFACRLGRLIHNGIPTDQFKHICCDSTNMNLSDWFVALGLSPQLIPQAPPQALSTISLSSFEYDLPGVEVHMNGEVRALEFPNYVTASVTSITFKQGVPPKGGFLHVLLLVDAAKKAHAVFATCDIPSEGNAVVVTSNSANLSFHAAISDFAVPRQDSYRHQYVLLVFYTDQRISSTVNVSRDLNEYLDTIPVLLSSSATGRSLGSPVAGTFYYMLTRRTLFSVEAESVVSTTPADTASFLVAPLYSLLLCLLALSLFNNQL